MNMKLPFPPELPMLDPVLAHGAAAALTLVLLAGALAKLADWPGFMQAAEAYELLPPALTRPLAALLCLTELLAGALLLPVASRPLGALLALAVLALASLAVALALRAGRAIDCGCGGRGGLPISRALLLRNAALLALAALAALPPAPRAVGWLDGVAACAAALFALTLYAVANQLLINQPRLAHLRTLP